MVSGSEGKPLHHQSISLSDNLTRCLTMPEIFFFFTISSSRFRSPSIPLRVQRVLTFKVCIAAGESEQVAQVNAAYSQFVSVWTSPINLAAAQTSSIDILKVDKSSIYNDGRKRSRTICDAEDVVDIRNATNEAINTSRATLDTSILFGTTRSSF